MKHHHLLSFTTAIAIGFVATAFAGHPQGNQMRQVKQIAHTLENQTATLHDQVENEVRNPNSWERQAMQNLHTLEEKAAHFHEIVENNEANPQHTENDYQNLSYAIQSAKNSFHDLNHISYRIQQSFRVAMSTFRQLSFFYQEDNGGWNWAEVKKIAHEIDEAANHVHERAEDEARTGGYWEREALKDLHQLDEAASHFHEQVEENRQGPRHTIQDFRKLKRTYQRATDSVHNARFTNHVMRDFRKVSRLLRELRRAYNGGGSDHWIVSEPSHSGQIDAEPSDSLGDGEPN